MNNVSQQDKPLAFTVRIHNETGLAVRVKSVGFQGHPNQALDHAYYISDFHVGQNKKITNFFGGQRALVAWDDVTREIVSLGAKDINANMHIWLLPRTELGQPGPVNYEIVPTNQQV